jgi:hypothetical protein
MQTVFFLRFSAPWVCILGYELVFFLPIFTIYTLIFYKLGEHERSSHSFIMPRGELPTAHELKILTMSWGKEKRTLKSLQTLNYSEILALKKKWLRRQGQYGHYSSFRYKNWSVNMLRSFNQRPLPYLCKQHTQPIPFHSIRYKLSNKQNKPLLLFL